MTITRIKQRRGTAAAWTAANPTLYSGEFGVETDTGKIKLGDGSTAWTALNYLLKDAALEGTPTAPTAAPGTDTTQIATTEFVGTAVDNATSVLAHTSFNSAGANDVFSTTSTTLVDVAAGAEVTFTVPASGSVVVMMEALCRNAIVAFGLREGAMAVTNPVEVSHIPSVLRQSATFRITGLTPGASKTYKAAFATLAGSIDIFSNNTGKRPIALTVLESA